ncbi:MAG: hypothetical protein Q4G03_01300 [Planctomycetia bacterium]|nr:hypothetical protein [Planctomycetia bacterium]
MRISLPLFAREQKNQRSLKRMSLETLEDRLLLSVTPVSFADTILTRYSCVPVAVASENINVSQPIALDTIDDASNAQTDSTNDVNEDADNIEIGFDIDYETLVSGNVRVLGQNGISYYSNYDYCEVPDPVYIELWNQALSKWEEIITVGAEDIVYPFEVDGSTDLEVDDLFLYFGFSDSFSTTKTLGSALNDGYYRDGGTGLAATGSLIFNEKYFVSNPSATVQRVFYNTALHEIAHALGYNVTHFNTTGLIETVTTTPFDLNDVFESGSTYYRYYGEKGVQQYYNSFPEYFTSQDSEPNSFLMETYTATGSYGAHPSFILASYYLYLNERDGMSYAIPTNIEVTITSMTLGVLEDLGYQVDYNYADTFGSPAPENLVASTVGKSVVLSWEAASQTSSDATYTVERYDVTEELRSGEALWQVVATDVSNNSFVDSTVSAGHEYNYRVRATNLRTYSEIGVYRAQYGDTISWESDDSRFRIYALVNAGSNRLGWTNVVSSTTNTSWTVKALDNSPYNGETLYRVVAIGSNIEETEPSRAVNVAVWTNANDYVPNGYATEDWNCIKRFLELTDENGVKNGVKIAGDDYSPDFLEDFKGLTWSQFDGKYRVTQISWSNYDLVGDLDLIDCSKLTRVVVNDNRIDQVELQSFTTTIVNVANNQLETLDVSNLFCLESLNCQSNSLGELDLSNNLSLIYLDVSNNALQSLDVSDSWELTTLNCYSNNLETLDVSVNTALSALAPWTTTLSYVYLPQGFAGTVDVSQSSATSYQWHSDGQDVDNGSAYTFTGQDLATDVCIAHTTDEQTIEFIAGYSQERPSAPSNLTFGVYKNGRLQMSWVDGSQDELGFKVYYRINGGEWLFASSIPSDATTSASTGTTITRTAYGLDPSQVYDFKVCSYKLSADGVELESSPLVGTFHGVADATPTLTITLDEPILVGKTLTASGTLDNMSLADVDGVTVQWLRVNANQEETEITNANEWEYTPTSDDVNCYLKVRVTVNNEPVETTTTSTVQATSLATPTDLVFGDLEDGSVLLSWLDSSNNEDGFLVYYRVDGQDWKLADSIEVSEDVSISTGTTISWQARGIEPTSIYEYQIYAYVYDDVGALAYSLPLQGVLESKVELDAPLNFIAYDYDYQNLTLQLSWDAVDNATQYEVQYRRSDDHGVTWRNEWTRAEVTSLTHRTAVYVHEDSFYGFRLRAVNSNGACSEWSYLTYEHTPTLATPESFVAGNYDALLRQLTLTWSAIEEAEQYEIQYRRSNDQGQSWQTTWSYATFVQNTEHLARGIDAEQFYEFRLRVRDSQGERSEWKTIQYAYNDVSDAVFDELSHWSFEDWENLD